MIKLILGDCLDRMKEIPAASVDMVLCDLPYGTTQNKWDSIIPLAPLWAEYIRICNGAIVLTAAQPFTSVLCCSNLNAFRYIWTWDKIATTGFLNAKVQPMRRTEDVCVFGNIRLCYNPQMTEGKIIKRTGAKSSVGKHGGVSCNRLGIIEDERRDSTNKRYPVNLIAISNGHSPHTKNLHPTQKPVALMEYLIRTYTNECDTVLDNTMGERHNWHSMH